ncbi:MAG: phasin family protein, partial [Sphingomonas bacterium]|nr:phasin family protein [Sphingomonas bacterium]
DPATFAADLPHTETAIPVDPEPAETIAVDAAPAPALLADAPIPMAAAAAVPEAALAPPAKIETAPLHTETHATAAAVPLLKGFLKMATAPEMTFSADKFQSMFGDVNERAKAAVEKTSKMAEELTELTKGNVEAIVASGRVAAKGAEAMTQEAADFSKKSFETATGAMKSFAAVKSPTELFQLQSEFARSQFDSMVAEASKVSESMLKLMGEMVQPLSTRYAVAAEKLKATTSL